MLTTTCIFQGITFLISWAKDQAGRICHILDIKEASATVILVAKKKKDRLGSQDDNTRAVL